MTSIFDNAILYQAQKGADFSPKKFSCEIYALKATLNIGRVCKGSTRRYVF